MKSIYQQKLFSDYWNELSGNHGLDYKRYLLDPAMFRLLSSLKGKTVLDLGCGNGYLVRRFDRLGAKRVILLDISKHNLENARQKIKNEKAQLEFLCQDATKPWRVEKNSVDVVFSDMLLNEIKNIQTPMNEAFKVLKDGGIFLFAVTHPGWDLWEHAKTRFGKKSKIISKTRAYFDRGPNKFLLSSEGLGQKGRVAKIYGLEHYNRPISDYFKSLKRAGFIVSDMVEPEFTKAFLERLPGYKKMTDHPISLIFKAKVV